MSDIDDQDELATQESDTTIDDAVDVKQISTSSAAKKLMQGKDFNEFFMDDMDKIKFAVCIAIREHLEPTPPDSTFQTSHNFANLDQDGKLSAILRQYKRTSTPARLTIQLAESGFRYIKQQFDAGDSFRDLI
jgi:hypothetical protein